MAAFVTQGALDAARDFIARVIALPEDGDGYIGLHNTWVPKNHKGNKLPFGQGVIANDPDDFVKKMQRMFTGNNRDIYVCMGTQKHYIESPNRKTGVIHHVPDKHRSNIIRLKSLYLDVDFKGGLHGYDSKQETDDAIRKFLGDSTLPEPSVVVHTGGGFHIYWVFTRPLVTSEWQVLAGQLVEATRTHGFKCDTQCSIDASRVLRVPNTLNYKYNPPRTVKIHRWHKEDYDPDDLAKILSSYVPTNITPGVTLNNNLAAFKGVKPYQGFQSTEEMTELGAGCRESTPIDLELVRPQCGFIREAYTSGGKDLNNALWNYTTLLSVFTTEGRKAAHVMARGHQDYTIEETDKLYDCKELVKSQGTGWPRCVTIKNAGAKECSTCVHFSKELYPFSFITRPATPQTPETPVQWLDRTGVDNLPSGFQRDDKGFIYKIVTDDDGNNFEMYPSRSSILSDGYLSMPPATIHFKAQITAYSDPVPVAMPNRYLYSQSHDMTNILGDAGVAIENKKSMVEFLMAWVEKLKESRKTFTEHQPFGWAENKNGIVGFAFAGKLYTPDGVYIAKEADAELAKQYHPQGDIEQWKRATKLVTDTKRPAMDAIIAAAFAAPLVYFTGEEGLYFGVHSEDSGIGKTTAMRAAQSVWAEPGALQRLSDTSASVQQKMGTLRHLPIAWDELKGDDQLKTMAALIFELFGGRSRSRLTISIQQRETVAWKTLLFTASNNSMADYINELAKNNDAGFYRLFELRAEPLNVGKMKLADANVLRQLFNTNFGVAGELYSAWLGQKFELAQKMVKDQQAKLEAEFNIQQAERNWLHVAVVLLVGAAIAKTLDLADIDIQALKLRLHEEIQSMRGTLAETPLKLTDREEIVGIFMQYIRDNTKRMVITSDIWSGVGRPKAGAIQLVYPITNVPLDGLVGQFGEASRTLRLAKRPLDEWLRQRKIPATVFKRCLIQFFNVTHKQKQSIGTGLPGLYGGQDVMLDFDCGQQDELGMLVTSAIRSSNIVTMVKP